MSDDSYKDLSEDELRHLEDEHQEFEPTTQSGNDNLPDPLYRIKVAPNNETYYAGADIELKAGNLVLAPTRYGRDLCEVLGVVRHPGFVRPEDVIHIERLASEHDIQKRRDDEQKERTAFDLCKQKIHEHNLPMKLIFAHYLFDEPKVLFFFTADSRVDFRDLVKDLVLVFKMRIELRQIGVRDEARVVGGCGVCGRLLCCHAVTDKLVPVSIKMAKDQNLSLNSLKISGPCGRLLCCLAYEFGFYREARRHMPSEGTRINFDGTVFKITEINVPAGRLTMAGEDGRYLVMTSDKFVHKDGRWTVRETPTPEA
ncbi:MAG: hypothetical protein A2087_05050 [Spirochaetes bacterium GWD1_61_31]|nr:MAG: hypothetical protein A2Y37_00080 [Spirochaetes bacterium GWB1_60_80]OHD32153.1 MAG: hypothetical protein A2004_05125 [Spirochaetes bacterium GWC1_61_12]OHD42387.1 MAG: hypothetical protein A2087_05050 [Spirochaetes bacterium GWD1_61_31]OHD42672.1 MAG: hypothetical protein A2Y35_12215 [Spirochaetes bacterium GWE1_60_18]OHD58553.1 MAG: hypothetical protein A2Y32_08795 [Spirochaetes bacterium GWF1_60_12]HAP43942.1 hypothetical protein [Spirochaetaceae bacterium]